MSQTKKIYEVLAVFTGALVLFNTTGIVGNVSAENAISAKQNGTAGATAYSVGLLSEAELVETETDTVASPIYGYTNLGIARVDDGNLNIRENPDEEAHMVGKLPNKAACEILDEVDGWYHITSGEIEGYVKASYVITGDEARTLAEEIAMDVVISHADNLRVREQPSTESEIITEVAANEEIGYLGEENGWYQVEVNGDIGYVSAEFAEHYEGLNVALSMSEARFGRGVSDVRVALVNEALKYVGNPYVWGGTSLTNGADCSGFVLSIFAQYGFSLPHSSAAQSNYGRRISASELQPGDLLFYGRGGRSIGHVAIYIGGGQIVHASDTRTGIRVSNAFYTTPVCCTSLLD